MTARRKTLRFLISAGPTREAIDPVRYLSNRSSGKMGYALAAAAARFGNVTLVSGPVALPRPRSVRIIRVESAEEMARAILRKFPKADITIQCAAVADYRPARAAKHKVKKTGRPVSLKLVPTTDILFKLGQRKQIGQVLVGFAAETQNLRKNALAKLRRKNLDFIVANPVGKKGAGFESESNQAMVFGRNGFSRKFSRMPKTKLARKLLQVFLAKS